MEFQRVAAILPVKDVAAAMSRYRQLGFDGRVYEHTTPEGRPFYGFLQRDGVALHLAWTPDLNPLTNTSAVYIYVDDPDALYVAWRAAGPLGQLRSPQDTDWGMREMSYSDPDGNLLRIGRRLGTSPDS
jgi:catechol 2,3-dioxygenase-like lactoylglutathione lyase family enzyme